MFIGFVEALRRGGIPASLKEQEMLLQGSGNPAPAQRFDEPNEHATPLPWLTPL